MRSLVYSLLLVTISAGCGSDGDQPSGPTAGTSGTTATQTVAGAKASAGAPAAGSGGSAASGAAGRAGDQTAQPRPTAGASATATAGMGLPTAGMPTQAPAAGAGPAPTAGAGGPGDMMAAAGAAAPAATPGEPKIPEAVGECPEFRDGTAMIGGLGGITLQVGEPGAEKGPLLFYWHGTGQTAGMVNSSLPSDVRQEIVGAGGIIMSPSGSLGTGGDCSGTGTFYKDDFKVADLVVACGVKNHNIDPKKIYTTGCSAGGLFAGCMAQERASYLAASAPNSGGIIGMQMRDDPHAPAIFTMHGGGADMVIVTFSETSKALDDQMAASGSVVVNCNHGGGHCGAPSALESAAWQFMKDHPFGTNPSPYAMGGLPASFPDYCELLSPGM